MSTTPYILSEQDVQTITKICTDRHVGVTCLEDIHDIIDILNNIKDYEDEYGTFGYAQEIECDYCVINDQSEDILIYGKDDKKYWLTHLIDKPKTYTSEWVVTAIQTIINIIDNSLFNNLKPHFVTEIQKIIIQRMQGSQKTTESKIKDYKLQDDGLSVIFTLKDRQISVTYNQRFDAYSLTIHKLDEGKNPINGLIDFTDEVYWESLAYFFDVPLAELDFKLVVENPI